MSEPGQRAVLNPANQRFVWIAAPCYVLIHLFFLRLSSQSYVNAVLVIVPGLLKMLCCLWWFARLTSSPARFRWLFLALGTLLNNISLQIYVWRDLLVSNHNYLSSSASLFTAIACIPILLAITLNFNKHDPPSVRIIDAALSLTLGYLFFVFIFYPAGVGESILSINWMIDFEGAFLVACAAMQFFTSDTAEDRRFLYVFFFYLVGSTPFVALRNRWAAKNPTNLWDLVVDASALLFILLALNPSPAWVHHLRPSPRIIHIARGSSPMFMSLALTLLGIALSRRYFYLGSVGVLLGIIGYGLRNAIIHGKLLETEGRLLNTKQELEVLASKDGLTGIPNRRLFDETMKREWRNVVQRGGTLAVLMIDIDFFKSLNDAYGHQVGDACLTKTAKALQDMLPRTGDFVGRYGGEEFAVILPATSLKGALIVAERLRSGIAQLAISHSKSPYRSVTVSIGAAIGDAASIPDLSLLLKAADEALYRAKGAGRNRVETLDLTVLDNLISRGNPESDL